MTELERQLELRGMDVRLAPKIKEAAEQLTSIGLPISYRTIIDLTGPLPMPHPEGVWPEWCSCSRCFQERSKVMESFHRGPTKEKS